MRFFKCSILKVTSTSRHLNKLPLKLNFCVSSPAEVWMRCIELERRGCRRVLCQPLAGFERPLTCWRTSLLSLSRDKNSCPFLFITVGFKMHIGDLGVEGRMAPCPLLLFKSVVFSLGEGKKKINRSWKTVDFSSCESCRRVNSALKLGSGTASSC